MHNHNKEIKKHITNRIIITINTVQFLQFAVLVFKIAFISAWQTYCIYIHNNIIIINTGYFVSKNGPSLSHGKSSTPLGNPL